ncbi:MAG TPA: hypothetical protein VHB77_18195, partial [Planctomycetaceae bacterium]|nr:hypothetical protein [Planctomycetaceae bacterium]
MHGFEELGPTGESTPDDGRPWYKLLTRYHWFVLTVAALGWLFDTMDQQLFVLAKGPAMVELLSTPQLDADGKPVLNEYGKPILVKPTNANVKAYSGFATMIFMLGWASGGLFFGV